MNSHSVVISLASNYGQQQNLHRARQCLEQILSSCHYTEAIWTEPFSSSVVGGASPAMYLNQLVTATTTLSVKTLESSLKAVERQLGRTAADRCQGIVRIDLDLMLYDGNRYHLKDWSRPYIQALLPQTSLHDVPQS